jgi:hypothetical protein
LISGKFFIFAFNMGNGKLAIIKFFIIISLCSVDGGRSLLFFGDKIQILLARDHPIDIDIPHHQHTYNLYEEEKWLEPFSFDFSCIKMNSFKFLYGSRIALLDYSDSIWQPPKFV